MTGISQLVQSFVLLGAWADTAVGQRPAMCGRSFAVSRVFGYFLPHKK